MKHFYRLVYWKRRLLGAGRVRNGGGYGRSYGSPYGSPYGSSYGRSYGSPYGPGRSRAAERRARVRRIRERARPLLVFAVIVGIVLAASALFGGMGGVGLP